MTSFFLCGSSRTNSMDPFLSTPNRTAKHHIPKKLLSIGIYNNPINSTPYTLQSPLIENREVLCKLSNKSNITSWNKTMFTPHFTRIILIPVRHRQIDIQEAFAYSEFARCQFNNITSCGSSATLYTCVKASSAFPRLTCTDLTSSIIACLSLQTLSKKLLKEASILESISETNISHLM